MKEEYLMLRDELLRTHDVVNTSRNILYIAAMTILSFAMSKNEPILYLIPYVAIIPIYLVSIDYTIIMYNIAAYLMVFHEKQDSFYWENRQYNLNHGINMKNMVINRAQIFHVPFLFSGLMCTGMFFFFLDKEHIFEFDNIIRVCISIILFITLVCIFFKYSNIEKIRKMHIDCWIEVKKAEISDKVGNNK